MIAYLDHYLVFGEGSQGKRSDKSFGGGGHDHLYLGAGFDEEAYEGRGFIGSDAAGNA
jgi:hypothetical protein